MKQLVSYGQTSSQLRMGKHTSKATAASASLVAAERWAHIRAAVRGTKPPPAATPASTDVHTKAAAGPQKVKLSVTLASGVHEIDPKTFNDEVGLRGSTTELATLER